MADIGLYDKLKSFDDYQRAAEEFALKKQMANAQLMTSQAQLAKAVQPDIEDIGKQAFLKAAQGQPITPQEQAALLYIDNKQQTVVYNPVTGAREEKPGLLDRAGLGGIAQPNPPVNYKPVAGTMSPPAQAAAVADIFGGDTPDAGNQYDADYKAQMATNRGNPKAQQQLTTEYSKAKVLPTEDQAKAAGFADRMSISSPIIDNNKAEGAKLSERALGAIPVVGNYLTSDGYQAFNQAQRDFINAQLRRESGAAISEGEFANARQQYFPQPGDSEAVLKQKAENRAAVISAMQRSAGASYKPSGVKPVDPSKKQTSGVKFLGFEGEN